MEKHSKKAKDWRSVKVMGYVNLTGKRKETANSMGTARMTG
jgi:hypothetical protein